MDTHGDVGDIRDGARIEINALTLASVQTLTRLARATRTRVPSDIKSFASALQKGAKKFLADNVVYDGVFFSGELDKTVRPNIFIAYYVYPKLFSKQIWKASFEESLTSLWLDWGGLSSISKTHPWFIPFYTAQGNRSYHRGDSWYWVNNIAALAMHLLDPLQFAFHVHRITEASCNDLLWYGIIGHAAELSSANEQTAVGCLAQAWSSATLVELLDKLEN
jgi:glycogen debranching enzyme